MKAKVERGSSISPNMQEPMNLKPVFSSFPQAIVVADQKGSIIECNQAMLNLSGYALKDEIIGKSVREFVSVKDQQRVMEKLRKTVEQGLVANIDCAFSTKDGCEFPAELTANSMKGPSESSSGFVVVIEDITERKKKEDALQENEERFKQVAENAQEWIWEVDAQGLYTYASPTAEKILGYKPEEIVGKKHFYDMFPLEDREELKKAAFETFTQKQEFQGFVNKNVHKKGNLVWLSTSGIPILDEKGTLLGYRGTDMEITERKKAEEALSSAEQKFRNIFEQAKDAFIYLDKFGNILNINAKTIEIFGGKKEELLGKNFTKIGIFSIKKIPMLMKAFMNALAGKEVNIELQIKSKKNKLIDLECSATPLKINGSIGIMVTAKDITERKKAEEALRESEEKYRTQFEAALDAIFIGDAETGILIDCNRAATELVGRKKSEIIGKHQRILHPPETIEGEFSRTFKQHREEKEGQVLETQVITKNGEIRDVAIKTSVFKLGNKRLIQGIFRDITGRKKAEEELVRLSSAVKMSTDSIVISSLDGIILDVNEATLKMYGSDCKKDLIGKSSFDLIAPEGREKALEEMGEVMEKGYLKGQEHQIITKDGDTIPVEMSVAIMKDADGKPIGLVAISRDITERKKTERALRESEEKYRELINGMNDTAWVIDLDGNFVDVNDAAVKVLGYSRKELLRMGPPDIDDNLTKEQILHLVRSMPADQVQIFETAHTTKDGRTIPVEISSSLVTYQGKQAILSIARDISERKKAEAAILRSKAEWERTFNSVPDLIAILDNDYGIVRANQAMAQRLGVTPEQCIGLKCYDAVHGTGVPPEFCPHAKTLLDGEEHITEVHADRLGGDFLVSTTPLKDERGQMIGSVHVARDITELKKSEEALKESEEKFRNLSEESPNMIFINKQGRVVYANKKCEELMGYTKEEFYAPTFNFLSIIAPESLKKIKSIFSRHRAGEEVAPYEYDLVTKAGKRISAFITTKLIKYDGEQALLGIITDITKRKEMEKELKESEIKFRTVADFTYDWETWRAPDGTFIYVSPSCERITGYKPEEFVEDPQLFHRILHAENATTVLSHFNDLSINKVAEIDFQIKNRNGEIRWIHHLCQPVFDLKGNYLGLRASNRDITESKQLQLALRESEEMFRAISTSAIDAIILLDDEARITYWNPAAEKIFGYTPKEALGKTLDTLVVPPKHHGVHSKTAIDNYQKGQTHKRTIEATALKRNGTKVPVEVSVTTLKIKNKKHMLGVIRDITERQKMEMTLREAEKRYHALFSKAPLGILVVDETGTAVEFNEEAHRQLGYTREEFAKLKISDYEVLETPEDIRAHIKKIMRERKDEFETKHRTKNGEIRDVINTVQLIELAGKKLFHTITRDITEQKEMERELKIEKDKLEAVTENIGAGLGIISKDYRILWVNKLLKQTNGDCEGKICFSTFNKLTQPCPDCGVQKVFENGVPIDTHEYSTKDDKGNTAWIELIATPIKDEEGNVVAALELAVNITERKLLQNKLAEYSQELEKLVEKRTEQLKQAQAKLIKSERLAAIGEMAAMVGHDLRNPLQAIENATYYLENACARMPSDAIPPNTKKMLRVIDSSVSYADKVVRDLSDFSGTNKLSFKKIDINTLIEEVLSKSDTPNNIEVNTQLSQLPEVAIDEDQMKRVFLNLITNGIQAMENGGILSISTQKTGDFVKIRFKDTGEGISKDKISKIFLPFFTTKAKGMGMGLAICKKFVENHKGTIHVESKVGKGTTFTVKLPIRNKMEVENAAKE